MLKVGFGLIIIVSWIWISIGAWIDVVAAWNGDGLACIYVAGNSGVGGINGSDGGTTQRCNFLEGLVFLDNVSAPADSSG